jgi:hypothetical protein
MEQALRLVMQQRKQVLGLGLEVNFLQRLALIHSQFLLASPL